MNAGDFSLYLIYARSRARARAGRRRSADNGDTRYARSNAPKRPAFHHLRVDIHERCSRSSFVPPLRINGGSPLLQLARSARRGVCIKGNSCPLNI
jgi:hypothetical protein